MYIMNKEWKKISGNREMLNEHFGVRVIRPSDIDSGYSIECSICDFLIAGLEDIQALDKFGCCQDCVFQWAQPRRHEWEAGWRPSPKQVNDYARKRLRGIN